MPSTANKKFNPDNRFRPGLPATLAKACERAENQTPDRCVLASTTGQAIYSGYPHRTNINMSDVYTRLIQDAGRFAESYASDLLYDIDAMRDLLSALPEDDDFDGRDRLDYYIAVGIRESGVDGNQFVMSRLEQSAAASFGHYANPRAAYRKLLCVHVTFTKDHVAAKLVDVTDHVLSIEQADKENKKNEGSGNHAGS